MPMLIHIDVPLGNMDDVQSQVELCCQESGDQLIGCRIYEDVEEVLLVVSVFMEEHLPQHIKPLNIALHQRQILSFQIESTNLIVVRSSSPCDVRDLMSGFPLFPNESWFPAITDGQTAYLCTRNPLLRSEQITWFQDQHLEYHYV